jgi:hypothetical protein
VRRIHDDPLRGAGPDLAQQLLGPNRQRRNTSRMCSQLEGRTRRRRAADRRQEASGVRSWPRRVLSAQAYAGVRRRTFTVQPPRASTRSAKIAMQMRSAFFMAPSSVVRRVLRVVGNPKPDPRNSFLGVNRDGVNRDGQTRTAGLSLPKRALYQAELRPAATQSRWRIGGGFLAAPRFRRYSY